MLIIQTAPSTPQWLDIVLKIGTPLAAAIAFFFGLMLRGRMNDKAISDLTIATTELAKVTHSLDKAVSVLSNTCDMILDDVHELRDRVDKNCSDISFIQGQQSVARRTTK